MLVAVYVPRFASLQDAQSEDVLVIGLQGPKKVASIRTYLLARMLGDMTVSWKHVTK